MSKENPPKKPLHSLAEDKHLVIIGGGSAAFAAALKASDLGARATIVNDGLAMGGTCVNVGCVPSKTLIRAAESLHQARFSRFAGISTSGTLTDFAAVFSEKQRLVEELRVAKYAGVIKDNPAITFIEGRASVLDAGKVEVNGEAIKADSILIATGARPSVPSIPGLDKVDYLTNETAFELDQLPKSILVLGGRYIALETAQMFARLGSQVTVLQRSDRIIPTETSDLTDALNDYLQSEGIEIFTGVDTSSVSRENGEVALEATVNGLARKFRAEALLLATGRAPNTNNMGLEAVGVKTNPNGSIEIDETLLTSVPGIYAAGDVLADQMFVYTAAYEGALAAENALIGSQKTRDFTALPWVIFTDPQVAGVGLDEQQAAKSGIQVDSTTLPLSHVPRSIAARDTRGFIKLIREIKTDKLVGARILAPEGSELLMELSLAIKFGITLKELASSFHPYLTLSEGVKLAALTFDKDIEKLSCCAS